MVGGPAAAEHKPVVGGALAVDDEVAVIAEGLTARESRLVPERGGQRTGGDDQRVHGHDRARCALRPHASMARTVTRARTTPRSVTTCRGPIESRWCPRRSARPGARGGGEPADKPGGLDPCAVRGERRAEHLAAPTSADASAASIRWTPSGPAWAASARARASWARERARMTVPPLTQSQAMPSSATTAPTPSTASRIAARIASAARARAGGPAPSKAGNSAEHQPPLRPLAPNPATPLDDDTRSDGSRSSAHAVQSPV